jgi:hypothetical protein
MMNEPQKSDPSTLSLVLSMRPMPSVFSLICANGWRSSLCRYIRIRHV